MGGEWRSHKLGDVCSLKYGKFIAKKDLDGGPYPAFSGYGVVGHHSEYLYEEPQLVVVCRGVGGSGDIKMSPPKSWITNLSIVVSPKDDRVVHVPFLYWALLGSDRSHWISGSAQYQVTIAHLERHDVSLPNIVEQRAIAHILGTLDDKIELNRRMNDTLEAMARALFKSWFVDFDPVRAKAQGQTPAGMDPATAALFPSEFEHSELGEIPKGWTVDAVSSIARLTSGKRPTSRFNERTPATPVPLYGGGGVMAFVPEPLYSEAILLTGRVGTLGLLFRVTEPCWPSDNTLVLLPTSDFDFDFLRYHLARIDYASLNRGSTQPLLTQRDLGAQQFVLPLPTLRTAFAAATAALFARQTANEKESATLAHLRDALLPRLLSGELSVAQAEEAVEATA